MHEVPISEETVRGRILAHGGHNNAILKLEIANLERGEQLYVFATQVIQGASIPGIWPRKQSRGRSRPECTR